MDFYGLRISLRKAKDGWKKFVRGHFYVFWPPLTVIVSDY